MIPTPLSIAGIGVWAPGLEGWRTARPVLRGESPHAPADPAPAPPPPACLPPNERRRCGASARLALQVADEAVSMSGLPPAALRNVFASSAGDGGVVHGILEALAADQPVSPTAFHNSVHNAAAGYWTIGHGCHGATVAIAAHDDSFAAGLLRAAAEAHAEAEPVLFCAYDAPLPPPLHACRPIGCAFGLAIVLAPASWPGTGPGSGPGALGRLTLRHRPGRPPPGDADLPPGLAALARANPAGRGLALLQAIARGRNGAITVGLLDGGLELVHEAA